MGRISLTIDSQLIDNWLPIDWQFVDNCLTIYCTVQVYRLYSTSVQTVQYKCTDCKVQAAEVEQKISGPKNI